ncbi:MAG TPA: DnaJ C-terminal domain-containing protein [Methylomirabilota bacterium]|nr:DnaJ C-terminal domain-containing protein [Methylomirabilota bacterium]
MRRDYYAVLGVGASATDTQIRRAYQRLARRYSPDVNLWEREAEALFEEIAEAYRVLSDPSARALYDRQGQGAGGSTAAGAGGSRGGRRGDDLHLPVELAFQQTVSGLEAELPVERLSSCDACGATGAARGAERLPCDRCDGLGAVWGVGATLESQPCAACGGLGMRVTAPCPECRGRGVRLTRARVRVRIPPGMDTGAQLRIPGEGHAGPFGGPGGDLIVIARVHDDPTFSRKGDNLYCEVPISIVEAVLGARVRVRGLDSLVDLVIPPGTQSGQVFRVRGKGMPRLSGAGRGDLYVTVRVEIPRGLDARTQEMFRELGRLLPEGPDRIAGGARA